MSLSLRMTGHELATSVNRQPYDTRSIGAKPCLQQKRILVLVPCPAFAEQLVVLRSAGHGVVGAHGACPPQAEFSAAQLGRLAQVSVRIWRSSERTPHTRLTAALSGD